DTERHTPGWRSVSAFAPIAAPMRCAWGEKAVTGYLGEDRERWKEHDASELVARSDAPRYADGVLVDQGLADQFLPTQLNPEVFEAARPRGRRPRT
ncbi:alpha/beta hydrolase-fold protein, partial [Burkholderia gladioli]|uniref:alpha/beta hydrolase-fold protein n=1 Tax=Burkholderia gladioli TaxID=28095 RepID=UPI003DA2507C